MTFAKNMLGNEDSWDVEMLIVRQTDAAIFATDTGDEADAIWLPKSQVTYEGEPGQTVQITMPQWLAEQRGLV